METRTDPRVLQTRRAVHAATLELIAECGLQAATVERIAERSGVARSTVYRRWPVLAELYYEAFATLVHRTPQPVRGDPGAELLAYLRDYAERLADPTYCSVLLALLDAAWRDPELAALRRRVFDERRSRAAAIVEQGVLAGRLRADLPTTEVVEAVVAPFLYRRLVEQQPVTAHDVERLHADLLVRFAVSPGASEPASPRRGSRPRA